MPKYVIERQYLLPIYQRLIIDAPDKDGPMQPRSSSSRLSIACSISVTKERSTRAGSMTS
jgi:hypothetical protein